MKAKLITTLLAILLIVCVVATDLSDNMVITAVCNSILGLFIGLGLRLAYEFLEGWFG